MKFFIIIFLIYFDSSTIFADCELCNTNYLKCKSIANSLPKNKINCDKINRNFYIEKFINLQKKARRNYNSIFDTCNGVFDEINNNDLIQDVAQQHRENEDVLDQCFGGTLLQNTTMKEKTYIQNDLNPQNNNFNRTKNIMMFLNVMIAIICLWILFSIFF